VLNDYNAKLSRSRELSKDIEREEQQLAEARASHQEQKEQATKELAAITKAISAAQDVFRKQKEDLKARMNEYLAQHKLYRKKVNTVVALLDTELGRLGMAKADIKRLSKRVHDAGSLVSVINQLERKRKGLQSKVDRLAQEKQKSATSIEELKTTDDRLQTSIFQNRLKSDELNRELFLKMGQLEKLRQTESRLTDDLYLTHLIIGFLFAPESIDNYDLDQLVSLMIGLRQKRLGIGPKQITDSNGKVICECQVPTLHGDIRIDEPDVDEVRAKFAHLLTPLVKDEFISRFDYDTREMSHKLDILQAIVEERNRHIT